METVRSQFEQWIAGELPLPPGFQEETFQAYKIADEASQRRLRNTYPQWFTNEILETLINSYYVIVNHAHYETLEDEDIKACMKETLSVIQKYNGIQQDMY